jgi:hypothetical protein
MAIPVERLLAGVSRTLLEEVLPHLAPRAARGRLYAAVEVLRNLERRLEWARAPLLDEADSIASALRAAAAPLRAAGAEALAARWEAAPAAWPGADEPAARAEAARAALADAFAALAEGPAGAEVAHRRLGAHLAAQTVRDLAPLAQGSLLEEISRG